MKKVIIYLFFLLPWFIGGLLFNYNEEFYNELNIPFLHFQVILLILYGLFYIF